MSNQHPAETISLHQKKLSLEDLKTLRVTSRHPLPDDVYKFMVPMIQISPNEWRFIFDAFARAPSTKREMNSLMGIDMTIEEQANRIPYDIYYRDACTSMQSEDLARRVAQMPTLFRIVILEAVERFWTRPMHGSWDEMLRSLGIPQERSAHQLMLASMLEKLLDSDERLIRHV